MQQYDPNQLDENGIPEFEPVGFYDAPATILTQVWDGEGAFARAVRTLAHSESLSPKERDSYATRLKKKYGGNAIMDTTIDVVTNPFTWLLLAITPFGAKQVMASGGKIFQGQAAARAKGQRTFAFVSELARVLKVSNLLNMGQTMAPSLIAQTITSRLDTLSKLESTIRAPSGRTAAEAREALLTKLSEVTGRSISDLDHSRHAPGVIANLLKEIDVMSHMWATGALEGGQTQYPFVKHTRGGTFVPVTGGAATGPAVPLLVKDEEYLAMLEKHKGAVRPGDVVTINGAEYQVGEHGVVVASDNANLKKLRSLFPKSERAGIRFRQIELTPENLFNVQGVDQAFFNQWADSRGIRSELMDYLESGRALREEMKKRLFYKLDGAGNPLASNELDVDKIINMWTKWQKKSKTTQLSPHEWAMDNLLPMEEIDKILPDWAKQAARRGSGLGVQEAELRSLVEEKMRVLLERTYLPRNNFTVYTMKTGEGGGIAALGPTHSDALMRSREAIRDPRGISSMVLPRRGEGIPWDPADLATIQRLAEERGLNPNEMKVVFPHMPESNNLAEAIRAMDRKIAESTTMGNRHVATHAMGYEMNMRTYMRDSMGTVILHGSQIPESTYRMLMEAMSNAAPQLGGAFKGAVRPGTALSSRQLQELQLTPEAAASSPQLVFSLGETISEHPMSGQYRQNLLDAHNSLQAAEAMAPGASRDVAVEAAKTQVERKQRALDRLGRRATPAGQVLFTGARPYMTLDDAIETIMRVENPDVQEYFQKIVLPGLFGGSSPTSASQLLMSQSFRKMARTIADSAPGRWIERNGGSMGENVMRSVREYGNLSGYAVDNAYAKGGITGYLYATHLGFNAVSAMWNMMQPLQWAMTWMGGEHILNGYASAFKQLGGYYTERFAKHGLGRMSAVEQNALWQKHIRLAGRDSFGRDLLGMGHDAISTMEGASFMRRPEGKPSLAHWLLIDTPLALFQAAEAVNRITVAEASMGWLGQLERQGVAIAANEKLDFAQLMQSMSNFNYNPITQLQLFQKGGVLGNSLIRMFLQYPSRTMANLLMTSQLGGGTRSFGLQRFGGPSMEIPAFIGDTARLLGTGAVAYEIGKNLFNINLSSGLAGSAVAQLPNQFMAKGIPIPPIIDIPTQILGSLADGDREQFRQAAFRLVPGGIALQKALGAFPALPGGGNFGIIQGQYADWGNKNQQGDVPIYDSNGMLQGFDSPLSLVMRGIGADFKKYKSPQEATKFLLANRAEMVDLRRKYKDAVLGNNMAAAAGIEAEYRKRYGVPMTVKPGEWDRAVSMREVPVSERMLDTMPSEVRSLYQQSLQTGPFARAMGLPEGALTQGDTAAQRKSIRGFNAPVQAPAPTEDTQ